MEFFHLFAAQYHMAHGPVPGHWAQGSGPSGLENDTVVFYILVKTGIVIIDRQLGTLLEYIKG